MCVLADLKILVQCAQGSQSVKIAIIKRIEEAMTDDLGFPTHDDNEVEAEVEVEAAEPTLLERADAAINALSGDLQLKYVHRLESLVLEAEGDVAKLN